MPDNPFMSCDSSNVSIHQQLSVLTVIDSLSICQTVNLSSEICHNDNSLHSTSFSLSSPISTESFEMQTDELQHKLSTY